MKKQKIELKDGGWCVVITITGYYPPPFVQYCQLCHKKFSRDDDMYVFVNNAKLFPNCLAHTACVDQRGSLKDCVTYFRGEWQSAQQYKHWFVKDEDEKIAHALRKRGWVVFRRPPEKPKKEKPVYTRACSYCEEIFTTTAAGQIYCSIRCRNRASYARQKVRKKRRS